MTQTIHRDPFSKVESLVARAMLGISVLIAFGLLHPSFQHGSLMGGDDPIHVAYDIALDRSIQETGRVFGWSYIYGLGSPLFAYRPPGFYLAVQALHLLSLRSVELLTAHKIIYMLSIVLYPVAIFYFLRVFKFRPLIAGIGALLALTPISSWGHTFDAYYDLGLAKQLIAILLFPVALAKLHQLVHGRARLLTCALVFAAVFLNHPYLAWSFVVVAIIYLGIDLFADLNWRRWGIAVAKVAAMIVFGSGLIGFWLVPFFSNEEIHPVHSITSYVIPGIDVMSGSAKEITSHYVSGSLFDKSQSRATRFGGESVWSWRDNSGRSRFPLLTVFSLIGVVFLAMRFREQKAMFLLAGWLSSLLIFMGPDDVTLIQWIPFSVDFQYIHYIAILEFFVICLSAIGIAALIIALRPLLQKLISAYRFKEPEWLATLVTVVIVCVPLFLNVYNERYQHTEAKLRTKQFEVDRDGQTAWSLRNTKNAGIHGWTSHIAESIGPFDRFFAEADDIWRGQEIYHFSQAPAYIQRSNVISPVLSNIIGGVNAVIHSLSRGDMLVTSARISDLVRLRAFLNVEKEDASGFAGSEAFPSKPSFESGNWRVYTRPEPTIPFGFTSARPILVIANPKGWEEICFAWSLGFMKSQSDPQSSFPFMVWHYGDMSQFQLDDFSAIYVSSVDSDPTRMFADNEWNTFRAKGGKIFVRTLGAAPPAWADFGLVDALRMDWDYFADDKVVSVKFSDISEAREQHSARVTTDIGGLLYFKTAFYRSWQIRVDGEKIPNISVSPGFNACRLDPGEHLVEFNYLGPNNGKRGLSLSVLTFVSLCLASGIGDKRLRRLLDRIHSST